MLSKIMLTLGFLVFWFVFGSIVSFLPYISHNHLRNVGEFIYTCQLISWGVIPVFIIPTILTKNKIWIFLLVAAVLVWFTFTAIVYSR